MKFCGYCGNALKDEATMCPRCGCQVAASPVVMYRMTHMQLLQQFASRLKTNGVIWLVIGIVQVMLSMYWDWWVLIVGVLNIITGIKDINRSNQIPHHPQGIVDEHASITEPVITLIYNLLIGGLIGVIGSIYYFVAIRGMVKENEMQFLQIEESFNNAPN